MTKTKPKPPQVPQAKVKKVPCHPCGGTGKVKVRQQTFGNGDTTEVQVERTCLRCGGTGRWFE